MAFMLPVALSIVLSRHEGLSQAQTRLDELSTDVLRRSKITRLQIDTAIAAMERIPIAEACTDASLQRMREVVADLNYLQGLGYLRDGKLLCTTFVQLAAPLELGPPHRVTLSGIFSWSAQELPGMPGARFNINSRNGHAALISPSLVLDTLPDPSVSLVHLDRNGVLVRSRGVYRREWLAGYSGKVRTFSDDAYFVTIHPADNLDTEVIAAMPLTGVDALVRSAALRFVPVGLILGGVLAGLVAWAARHHVSLKAHLRRALRRREFFLLYQPVIELRTRRCVGAEALIRWKRPSGKPIGPAVFIPEAEKHGLIQHVTAQVMDMVAEESKALIQRHPEIHIAINFSADDLHSDQTEARLRALVAATGGASHNIVIEATERGLIAPDKAQGVLMSMRAKGFKVAIDDFGTGNSSLSYLATYDLDYLKIDKSFIDALGRDTPGSRVAFHIVEMAKTLRLQMVAEGVETQEQHDILAERGVQFAQGWLYAKPMPMEALLAFVGGRNDDAAGDPLPA
ncbi:EAL domain-containing protein [Pseudoxanthomonas sp. GM95]|uniref:EAL domain-containing protein n=1 Tax=Pseudoxanthomonas sp. GM95 TaxID=1881043 RepID=UPI001C31ABDF|nr:EAL domain-containing protein [Pseudoxanthomonas sp. GM95]